MRTIIIFFTLLLTFFSTTLFADDPDVTLINNMHESLRFVLDDNQYAPHLPPTFVLKSHQRITTTILPNPNGCHNPDFDSPSVYMRAIQLLGSSSAKTAPTTPADFAFLGVNRDCHNNTQIDVDGFLSSYVAYNWQSGHHAFVVFCNANQYPCFIKQG